MTTQPGSHPPTTPKRPGKMNQSQSLNHLLNFTLPPRQAQPLPRRSRKYGTQPGVWNKERFVNAQYRFVMNPTGDYTVHFADPDIFFQWQDILQVIIPRSSAMASAGTGAEGTGADEGHTTCPICLSPPVAPRMTKCGHVFCFPCILHLLNTSENLKWVRCPICFDSVNEKQLKCVKWYEGSSHLEIHDEVQPEASSSSSGDFLSTHEPGSTMLMRLMQRPQISTLALPRSQTWPSDLLPPHQAPFHFLPDVYEFAKFMLATPAYLITDLTRDLDQLTAERRTLTGMSDDLGVVFVDAAEQKVRHQMAKAAALETSQLRDAVDRANRDQHEIEARAANVAKRKTAEEARAIEPIDVPEAFLAVQSGPAGFHREPQSATAAESESASAFDLHILLYQCASGLPIFLHPLDIKILFAHFHGYAAFPDRIAVRVEASHEGAVDDDLRRRCKYLGHLPAGADVVFVEADLQGVVGAEGLRPFEGAVRMRRSRRREKGRKDDKARVRAEERERERRLTERDAVASAGLGGAGGWADVATFPLERPVIRLEEFPVPDVAAVAAAVAPPRPVPAGAWGSRSFATALHANASDAAHARTAASASAGQRARQEDEWDVDGAWDDLEQQITSGSGARRKRGAKMVVLGGGGGRRR